MTVLTPRPLTPRPGAQSTQGYADYQASSQAHQQAIQNESAAFEDLAQKQAILDQATADRDQAQATLDQRKTETDDALQDVHAKHQGVRP